MESKPLKQQIAMALDILGMGGPVTRRDVAEEVMRHSTPACWSVADRYDADMAFIQRGVRVLMNETHSPGFIDHHLSSIPEEIRDTLREIPTYICISPRGGRGAVHIRTLMATKEHWAANFELKDRIVQATRLSRNASRDIRNLLDRTGAGCLADLLNGEKVTRSRGHHHD